MMASLVRMMGKDLRGGRLIAADGRLQDRWTVHELLWRRLNSMHGAGALNQGENDKVSSLFG